MADVPKVTPSSKDTSKPEPKSPAPTSPPVTPLKPSTPSEKIGDASEANSIAATAGSDTPPVKSDEEAPPTEGDESLKDDKDVKDAEVGPTRTSDSPKAKRTPYINPNRFLTGGTQKEKLTPEELAERMDRIRLNNEKIKERRIAVQADEQAFKASQHAQHAKDSANRKIQEGINRSREQNARRKLDKIGGREWDSSKKPMGSPGGGGKGRGEERPAGGPAQTQSQTPSRAATQAQAPPASSSKGETTEKAEKAK